jgi:uncharacterized membrane protein
MSAYEALKFVHIVSATILFGTGLGTAYYFWTACLTGDTRIIAAVGRRVILADWIFTGGSGAVQPLTGVLLAMQLGIPLNTPWIVAAAALYLLAFLCWMPVVWIQMRGTELARRAAAAGEPLPVEFHRLMRLWFALGWPAFIALLAVFALMIVKPDL